MSIIRQQYMREIQDKFHNTYAWRYLSPVMRMEMQVIGKSLVTPEYIAELAEEEMGDLPDYKTWLKKRRDERRERTRKNE